MADKKISELTALTGANVATDDQLVIVDTSAALTKNITIDEFKNALDTATGFVRITGDTMTGDLALSGADVTFGDNDKAIFGAGSDLQIYHDAGGDSYITESNASGQLRIQAGNIKIADADGNNFIYMTDLGTGGLVNLYHNGSEKLATTNTGVDITGTLTSDGLTVDADTATILDNRPSSISAGDKGIIIGRNFDTPNRQVEFGGTFASFGQSPAFYVRTADKLRLKASDNGDISFYEDTGTTAKLHWSAADERLGIGTSSPTAALHIASSGGTVSLVEASSGYNARVRIQSGNANESFLEFADTDDSDVGEIVYSHANNSMRFNTNATERMRIDSSGNVGIGESNPDAKLHIRDATDGGSSSTTSAIQFSRRSGGANDAAIKMQHDGSDGVSNLQFHFGTSEAMRIDSSGNLLVGHTSITDWTTTAGAQVRGTGYVIGSVDGDYSFIANRLTSDGDIMQFRKDGTTVGSIGTTAGVLTLGNANTGGIIFGYNAGHTFIEPSNTSGASTDDLATLGSGTKRFRDLYLSGGVVFGDAGGSGTSSSNTFDSYEEGTWSPAVEGSTTAGSGTYSGNAGRYVKVGQLVTVIGYINCTAHTGAGDLLITGLPYTQINDSANITVGSCITDNLDWGGYDQVNPIGSANTTRLRMFRFQDNGGWTGVALDSSFRIHFESTYTVA